MLGTVPVLDGVREGHVGKRYFSNNLEEVREHIWGNIPGKGSGQCKTRGHVHLASLGHRSIEAGGGRDGPIM